MPRIRTIKPEFWTDGEMLSISRDARLFYIGLWNFADDNGVLDHDLIAIKARIFPNDQVPVDKLLAELVKIKKVIVYKIKGKQYICVKNLKNHQIIDRPRHSNLPPPSRNQLKSIEISSGREGKGREGKGRERKGKESNANALLVNAGALTPADTSSQLMTRWNELAVKAGLSQVAFLTNGRKRKISARLRKAGFVEKFMRAISMIPASDFLLGLKGGWKVNFDWLIRNDENIVKILEGRYLNAKSAAELTHLKAQNLIKKAKEAGIR